MFWLLSYSSAPSYPHPPLFLSPFLFIWTSKRNSDGGSLGESKTFLNRLRRSPSLGINYPFQHMSYWQLSYLVSCSETEYHSMPWRQRTEGPKQSLQKRVELSIFFCFFPLKSHSSENGEVEFLRRMMLLALYLFITSRECDLFQRNSIQICYLMTLPRIYFFDSKSDIPCFCLCLLFQIR